MNLLTSFDLHLLSEGKHYRSYEKLGAHVLHGGEGASGTHFAVWAPHAREVSVIGDFNRWDPRTTPLVQQGPSGIWAGFVPGVGSGSIYKYSILPSEKDGKTRIAKADPFAFAAEVPPRNASKVWDLSGYDWGDADWMSGRGGPNSLNAPISIYEVHLGSWMRVADQGHRRMTFREVAPRLADYAHEMGFTHVELMPVAEHPFEGSWGYQITGYFAANSRLGTPQDLMYLIDTLHRRGIGVILDWVPAHFPRDDFGLAEFDGGHVYEHPDPRKGLNVKWNTCNFNFEDPRVVNFLIANALFWLDRYHADALRVDAVEALLHLDFYKDAGEWVPNRFGGRENLEAIAFMQRFNDQVHQEFPTVLTIAEDASARPDISRPTHTGGLGFDLKWDMGWVHDTVDNYLHLDPINRKSAHHKLVFRMDYAFKENYILPLSHDEVVYGKGSLLNKMPGDTWQKFASLRVLYGEMFTLPAKKLLFMGDEFGQAREWNHDFELDWHLLEYPYHRGLQRWVRDLNTFYRGEPILHQLDHSPEGFSWRVRDDADHSVIVYFRRKKSSEEVVLVACNFTPIPRYNYRVGVPQKGRWEEFLNSDAPLYGGSGQGNMGGLMSAPVSYHGYDQSLNLTLPPLGIVALRKRG